MCGFAAEYSRLWQKFLASSPEGAIHLCKAHGIVFREGCITARALVMTFARSSIVLIISSIHVHRVIKLDYR
jgi:hypothetical protein